MVTDVVRVQRRVGPTEYEHAAGDVDVGLSVMMQKFISGELSSPPAVSVFIVSACPFASELPAVQAGSAAVCWYSSTSIGVAGEVKEVMGGAVTACAGCVVLLCMVLCCCLTLRSTWCARDSHGRDGGSLGCFGVEVGG